MTANFRGICNQRRHWAQQCIDRLHDNDAGPDELNQNLLRDSAMLQLQIAYVAHLGDLMVLKSAAWQGQRRAVDILYDMPEVQELQALERDAAWLATLLSFGAADIVEASARNADPALLASTAFNYKSIDNNTIKDISVKLDELIARQREHLLEY